jgi:hypothetical protein
MHLDNCVGDDLFPVRDLFANQPAELLRSSAGRHGPGFGKCFADGRLLWGLLMAAFNRATASFGVPRLLLSQPVFDGCNL